MRVTDYELYPLPGKSQLLKLETSTGLVGWGEPVVEGKTESTAAAVETMLEEYLLGEDSLPTEDHWETMYRGGFYRGGPVLMSAIAGIDQALWDIKGKHFDAPIYELLGGKARDRIKLYRWTHGVPERITEDIATGVENGFRAFKMNAVSEALGRVDAPARVEDAAERVEAARDAIGPDMDLAVDFHGRVAKPMAKRLLRALEPAEPLFVEEPVLPEHSDSFPDIATATTTPLATGERLFSRHDFKPLLEAGGVDVVQPDLSHAGGITEVKKIASLAESYDAALAPHCPLGPVALASCLQVDACAPNAMIQEQSILGGGVPEYVDNPEVFERFDDGYLDLPEGPGLGIEIDEDRLGDQAGEPWSAPVWRHTDGSIAEQ